MEIKTIGDLRNLVNNNSGELKIGGLKISFKDGEDIDIHFNDYLLEWYAKDSQDDAALDNEDALTISSDLEKQRSNNRKLEEELQNTKKELEIEKAKAQDANLALGKVEAYEKLLLNRSLNISK